MGLPLRFIGSAQCRIDSEAARYQQWPSRRGFRPGGVRRRPTPLSCRNVGMTRSRPCARAAPACLVSIGAAIAAAIALVAGITEGGVDVLGLAADPTLLSMGAGGLMLSLTTFRS